MPSTESKLTKNHAKQNPISDRLRMVFIVRNKRSKRQTSEKRKSPESISCGVTNGFDALLKRRSPVNEESVIFSSGTGTKARAKYIKSRSSKRIILT